MTGKTNRIGALAGCLPVALAISISGAVCGVALATPASSVSPPSTTTASSPVAACRAPAPGNAGCLAVELLPDPDSPAARSLSPHARARALRAERSEQSSASSEPLSTGAAPAVPLTEPAAQPATESGATYVEPAALHSAYDLPENSPSTDGTQTIALVDAYNDLHAEADLRVYDEAINHRDEELHLPLRLPPCTRENGCFEQVNQHGETTNLPFPASQQALEDEEAVCKGTRSGNKKTACEEVEEAAGWGVEISTDLDVAHSVCENCRIRLVEAASAGYVDLEAAERTAERPSGDEDGIGATEISNSWGGEEPPIESEAFNHPGVVITAAAGDFGYRNWTMAEEAQAHHETYYSGTDYPASSPHVVAVGGTKLTQENGIRVRETAWNEDPDPSGENSGAGGGGCSAYFTAQEWQKAVPDWSQVGCGSKRAVADVAADGDPYTGVLVYDSAESEDSFIVIGGTSVASPIIAAAFALGGGAQGVAYPAQTLYSHLGTAGLYDVLEGGNGRCHDVYSGSCSGSMSPSSGLYPFDCGSGVLICNTGPGYDGPTGVGTPYGICAFQPLGATTPQAEECRRKEAEEQEAREREHETHEQEAHEHETHEHAGNETKVTEARQPGEEDNQVLNPGDGGNSTQTGGGSAPTNTTTGPGSGGAPSSGGAAGKTGLPTVRLSELALTPRAVDALHHRRPAVSYVEFTFRLSAAARVRVTLSRQVQSHGRRRWRVQPGSFTDSAASGRDRLRLAGRRGLPPGVYLLTLAPAGGRTDSISFVLR